MSRGWVALLLAGLVAGLALAGCSATPTPPPTPSVTPTVTANWTATPSNTPTRTATPTWTPAPTRTITPTATQIPTATPTALPALVGTALPAIQDPIIEANLPRLQLLAQWGRGRVEGLAWSSQERIAVSTPLGVYLYDDPQALVDPHLIVTQAPAGRLAFSADGRWLAVDVASPGTGGPLFNSRPGTLLPPHRVQVWDVSGAEPQLTATLSPEGLVLDMRFTSPDELLLLTRREDGAQVQRWSVSGQSQVQALNLIGGESAVQGVFSQDLALAATHGESGPVRIWRLADGINLATTRETGELAGPMAFSPDGRSLAVGYPDDKNDFANLNMVRVWTVPDGGPFSDLSFILSDPTQGEGARETLLSVAWSPDGQMIAAGTEDYRVHVWKATPSLAFRQLTGDTLPRFLVWSADSNRLVTGGVEVWRVAEVGGSNERLAAAGDFLPGIFDMRFTPDGSALALAGYNRVDLRSVLNGTVTQSLRGMQGPVNAIAFDPTGELMVAACQDGTARVYLVQRGIQTNLLGDPTYPMLSVDFSYNGLWIAVAGENMLVHIYRVVDGELMMGLKEPFVSYQLEFAPNSDQLASLTTSGVRLRSIDTDVEDPETLLQGVIGGVSLSDMAYSYDGQFLGLVGNNVVRVVNALTRDDVYTLAQPPNATPLAVAFSPDNAFLAVGWSDGFIRLYWVGDGSLMDEWPAHSETVQRLAFTDDSRMLASQGGEGVIRIWGIGN